MRQTQKVFSRDLAALLEGKTVDRTAEEGRCKRGWRMEDGLPRQSANRDGWRMDAQGGVGEEWRVISGQWTVFTRLSPLAPVQIALAILQTFTT